MRKILPIPSHVVGMLFDGVQDDAGDSPEFSLFKILDNLLSSLIISSHNVIKPTPKTRCNDFIVFLRYGGQIA